MKFGRTWEMAVAGVDSVHVFGFPLTLRFDVDRNLLSRVNTGKFSVFNLNTATRKDLQIDRTLGYNEYRSVQLNAGYLSQSTRPVIFKGNIKVAYTDRQGPELITQVDGFDGGFAVANSFVSLTKPKGWNFADAAASMMATMGPNFVKTGTISPIAAPPSSRGAVFNGNTWNQLQRLAAPNGSNLFIDNEVAHLLADPQTIVTPGGIFLIQASTGLLGIPRIQGNFTFCTTLLEAGAGLGQLAELNSKLNPGANGTYKIFGYHHYGTIGGTQGGEAYTDWSLARPGAPV